MLVLARKVGEKVVLILPEGLPAGEEIEVMPITVNGSQVRLGFQARREIQVHREEVWDAIKTERAKAG